MGARCARSQASHPLVGLPLGVSCPGVGLTLTVKRDLLRNDLPADRVIVVYDGVSEHSSINCRTGPGSLRLQSRISPEHIVILMPGRITRKKGQHVLISAIRN